jgi:uncharacterized protein (DUF1697 family)
MNTYISLLRGINVSGKNMIKMPDLVRVLEEEGFINVSTYIQSGNIIFYHPDTSCHDLARKIEDVLLRKLYMTVPALVMTPEELSAVIAANPFTERSEIEPEKLHVTFLDEKPAATGRVKLLAYSFLPDEIMMSGKTVYLYLPNGYGRTKFNNTFIENKLGVTATTRKWETCLTLQGLLSAN